MCTILLAWRCVAGAPLLLAANRDELLARPTAPPEVLDQGPPVVAGGRDLLAGGTWMAVAADGRVAAVTNRHVGERDPSRRSRGELPLLALVAPDARSFLGSLAAEEYNPANLLMASAERLLVRHLDGDGGGLVELEPGIHVVTTVDVDDAQNAKVARLRGLLRDEVDAASGPEDALARMDRVCADHGSNGDAGLDAACVHGDLYGTVSSSSVAVLEGGGVRYRHVQGHPHDAAREDLSALLR